MCMKYKKLPKAEILQLQDMHTTLQYGSVTSDRRIQVVMPSKVVQALDETFPEKDRSAVLTSLAIEAILNRQRFADNPELNALNQAEQEGLNTMLDYLEKREKNV